MQKLSDNEIVKKYLTGDENALEVLIKRYLKPIYGFVYKNIGDAEAAQDITQETFVKMWKNLNKFQQNKSFKSWIFAIAKNTSIDFLRKKKTLPFSCFENKEEENKLVETLVDLNPLPDELFRHISATEIVSKAIDKLSLKSRSILLLHYKKQLTFKEIAKSLGEPFNTVKSRYRRALIELKGLLANF